jgi:hypothetical protein
MPPEMNEAGAVRAASDPKPEGSLQSLFVIYLGVLSVRLALSSVLR